MRKSLSTPGHRFIPHFSDEEIVRIQTEGLRKTIGQALKSRQYSQKLKNSGIATNDVVNLDDLHHLPLVDADDLREGYPFAASMCAGKRYCSYSCPRAAQQAKEKSLPTLKNDIDTFVCKWPDVMKWLDSPPKTECRLQLAMVCGPQAQAFNLGVSFWHDDYTCGTRQS